MNTFKIMFILACLVSLSFWQGLSSQTCRVSVGQCANGISSYIEVYEYDYVDIKPEFPGGSSSMLSYVNEHRNYPSEAYASGIEGRVTCSFVVNQDGTITNICVIKGVEDSLNEEAVRLLSEMPNWSPGSIKGQQVPVRVVYCVPFRK